MREARRFLFFRVCAKLNQVDNWLEKHGPYLKNNDFLKSLGMAFLFLFLGIVITYFSILYATDQASGPVTDIILNNIPVFDVDGIFVYGPIIFWIITAFYLITRKPNKIPFALKSIGLFLLIRSVFISLTHIGPFIQQAQVNNFGILGVFTSGSDLFFSSHTGLPFLMALVFWESRYARILCIAASIFFGAIVLMAHLHYSIDVFGAFFITYSIFKISERFFKKEKEMSLGTFRV